MPILYFHIRSPILPLQIHILQRAEARALTGGPPSKHVDIISPLDSEQHGSLWASLSARANLQERSPRFPLKKDFRPRLMHLRGAVYRTAAFNLTLIKHFRCRYRNRVTNPNSTLLTRRRLSLQDPIERSFYGQSGGTGLQGEAAVGQTAEAP